MSASFPAGSAAAPPPLAVARALELLGQTRGRERALETVRGYVDDVERELDALPDGPAREALRTMTRMTVERVG